MSRRVPGKHRRTRSARRFRPRALVVLAGLVALGLPAGSALAAPANDNFANATIITGTSGSVDGANYDATHEPGEPRPFVPSYGSVWYSWTAPTSGIATFELCNSGVAFWDSYMGVYAGSALGSLEVVAVDDDGCSTPQWIDLASKVTFDVTGGVTYRLAVDNDVIAFIGDEPSWFVLRWSMIVAAANNDFPGTTISAAAGSIDGTTYGATGQPGEPDHAGASGHVRSVWYSWTAPSTSRYTFDTCTNLTHNTILAIYTGSSVGGLTPVASNNDGCGLGSRVDVVLTGGVTYRFAVDGVGGESAEFRLSWTDPPANDDFPGVTLSGESGSTTGSTVGAGAQAEEPNHAGVSTPLNSVWYSWTAPSTGLFAFDTCVSTAFNTTLAVYTGSSVGSLTEMTSNDDFCGLGSLVRITAESGTTYRIAVDGSGAANKRGTFTLRWSAPPANDDFPGATLTGASGVVDASTGGATGQTGEPSHASVSTPLTSVWYTWTAPTSGSLTVDTCANGAYDTTLAVYTGSAVNALTLVNANNNGCSTQSRVVTPVTSGVAYRIAVDGAGGANGPFTLTWTLVNAPANDDFDNAQTITGASGSVSGNSSTATAQAGEPAADQGSSSPPLRSVWYRWKSPVTGTATFSACSPGQHFAAAFTGAAVNALTRPTTTHTLCGTSGTGFDLRADFAVTAGITYFVKVESPSGSAGAFTLSWSTVEIVRPPNDNFPGQDLTGGSGSVTGTTANATGETGEPLHAGGSVSDLKSIWYTWTAPGTGQLQVRTCNFSILPAVYTGSAVNALSSATLLGSGAISGCAQARTYAVRIGRVYRIGVDETGGGTGAVNLSWSFTPAPANDDYPGTTITGARGSVTGTVLGATGQTGEPTHGVDGGVATSTWYRWTAPSSGTFMFGTCASTTVWNSIVAVYTGSAVGALSPVASDDFSCPNPQFGVATFAATAGVTYSIAVDGFGAAQGPFTLSWNEVSDAFPGTTISGTSGSVNGSNAGATGESGEPDHAGASTPLNSIWYSWTAPSTGSFTFHTCGGAALDTTLAVYTGTPVDDLTPVASNNDGCSTASLVTFDAVEGTTYRIAVDGAADGTGAFLLGWVPTPTNDAFPGATLTGPAGSVSGTTVGATGEPDEPEHIQVPYGASNAPSNSVWYSWTAPADGALTLGACDSEALVGFAIYSGSTLAGLSPLGGVAGAACAGSLPTRVMYPVSGGTVYRVAMDFYGGLLGAFGLEWSFEPAPGNDDFAGTSITGADGSVDGTTLAATGEAGEPTHGSAEPLNSVWYSWTAPSNGSVTFDTCSNGTYDTRLAAYAGSAVDGLSLLAANNDAPSCGTNQSRVTFEVVAGQVYRVAVDGTGSAQGTFTLSWTMDALAFGDDFPGVTLSGAAGSTPGSNFGATGQVGEVNHAGVATPLASAWFSWTAPGDGRVTFDTCTDGTFDTVAAAYTGADLSSLSLAAANDDGCAAGAAQSRVNFAVTNGTTYRVVVDGYSSATGLFTLSWQWRPTVPTPGTVSDGSGADVDSQTSTTTIAANWTGFADDVAVDHYVYGVSSIRSCATRDVVPDLDVGVLTSWSTSGLALAEGTAYFSCVDAYDAAGNHSGFVNSNGVLVLDQTSPTPGSVNDGPGADIDTQGSQSTLQANWTGFADNVAIDHYEFRVSTSSSCATALAGTTDQLLTDSAGTFTGLATAVGTTYYACVRGFDAAGSSTGFVASDGVLIMDDVPPTAGTVNDGAGADIDAQSSTTTVQANWTGFSDNVAVDFYRVRISPAPDCGTIVSGGFPPPVFGTSVTVSGLSLTVGSTYYACIQAVDVNNNAAPYVASDGVLVTDSANPTSGSVHDGLGADIDTQTSQSILAANWTGFADNVGIHHYQVGYSTSPTCAARDVRPDAGVGPGFSSDTAFGLSLSIGTTYYACVDAYDAAGNHSGFAASDGVTVVAALDTTPPTAGSVNDGSGADVDAQALLGSMASNWSGFSDNVGIDHYVFGISSVSDCSTRDVFPSTQVSGLSRTTTGLTLSVGSTYYACVQAVDAANNESGWVASDGLAVVLPQVSVSDVTVTEGNSGTVNAFFTYTIDLPTDRTVTVDWASADGTGPAVATQPSDYLSKSGVTKFFAGQTSKTALVQVKGDAVFEADENFRVLLSNPVNLTIADGTGVGTITNDDTPTIAIGDVTVTEGNSGTTSAFFPVTLSGPKTTTVTVAWVTADGSATAPADYVAANGVVTFHPGQTAKNVLIQVKGELVSEPTETFRVDLLSPSGAALADGQGVGTITNDDAPGVRISDTSVIEGHSDPDPEVETATLTFNVTLTQASSQEITVHWATADGATGAAATEIATQPSDYTAASGTVTFPPNDTSETVQVTVTSDLAAERNEKLTVNLSSPVNASILDGIGIGTITNDDIPSVSVNDVTVTETHSGTKSATFTISLSGPVSQTVTVHWATADDSATAPADYTSASGTVTFSPGQTSKTVIVQVKGERVVEPTEAFFVNLDSPANATLGDAQGLGTITNDD